MNDNGPKTWQISIGISIAMLTLIVMIWGFGYRLGRLIEAVEGLSGRLSLLELRLEKMEKNIPPTWLLERVSKLEGRVSRLEDRHYSGEDR